MLCIINSLYRILCFYIFLFYLFRFIWVFASSMWCRSPLSQKIRTLLYYNRGRADLPASSLDFLELPKFVWEIKILTFKPTFCIYYINYEFKNNSGPTTRRGLKICNAVKNYNRLLLSILKSCLNRNLPRNSQYCHAIAEAYIVRHLSGKRFPNKPKLPWMTVWW